MRPLVERLGLPWNEEWELQYHRDRFDPSSLRMVYQGQKRIGFVGVRTEDDAAILELGCLEPAYQKKGLGSFMLEKILAEPLCKNRIIRADTLIGNPVARLLERYGFKRIRQDAKSVYYERPLFTSP